MTHKLLGNKEECQNAFSYLKETLDETILEKPVFPRLTEVVLDRTFDIKNAQKLLDEKGFNVGLFDSGFAYHINSRGIDKGSGLINALEMLNVDRGRGEFGFFTAHCIVIGGHLVAISGFKMMANFRCFPEFPHEQVGRGIDGRCSYLNDSQFDESCPC